MSTFQTDLSAIVPTLTS